VSSVPCLNTLPKLWGRVAGRSAPVCLGEACVRAGISCRSSRPGSGDILGIGPLCFGGVAPALSFITAYGPDPCTSRHLNYRVSCHASCRACQRRRGRARSGLSGILNFPFCCLTVACGEVPRGRCPTLPPKRIKNGVWQCGAGFHGQHFWPGRRCMAWWSLLRTVRVRERHEKREGKGRGMCKKTRW